MARGRVVEVGGRLGAPREGRVRLQRRAVGRGLERVRARGKLEVYAKVGQAYGFLTTNAYVVEKASGKAFFLAATVYANPNEVINDDLYAYDDVAFPALADVAEAVAREALGE